MKRLLISWMMIPFEIIFGIVIGLMKVFKATGMFNSSPVKAGAGVSETVKIFDEYADAISEAKADRAAKATKEDKAEPEEAK